MERSRKKFFTPRIIIHGGAGNITRPNLPEERQTAYRASLLRILNYGDELLRDGVSALDAAASTVSKFEDDPLFNCGRGAVFNRAGEIELEASVMVSSGYKKKGAAVSLLRHVKNPILFAKRMLEEGEHDMEIFAESESYTAQGHVHISGQTAEALAKTYGLELRPQKYFWTRKRWEEHKRGLGGEPSSIQQPFDGPDMDSAEDVIIKGPSWDGHEYLPQGTVGCVVMDKYGVICTATSTGGLTNKLPGRIGDTPTFGAGFWAEGSEKRATIPSVHKALPAIAALETILSQAARYTPSFISDCLSTQSVSPSSEEMPLYAKHETANSAQYHVVGLSGTGNGDSFLRVSACRTASALAMPPQIPSHLQHLLGRSLNVNLSQAVAAVAGPGGILQHSAEDRWGRTGEGEGGIIGVERRGDMGQVVFDFNSGGMFRGYIDDKGRKMVGIFRDDDVEYRVETCGK